MNREKQQRELEELKKYCTYDYESDKRYYLNNTNMLKLKMKESGYYNREIASFLRILPQYLRELINGRQGIPSMWSYDMVINLSILLDLKTSEMFEIWAGWKF